MLWFLTLASIAAYIVGLILLVRITPRLLKQSFDDPFFLLTAAGAILGAMLAFGGIGILFVAFSELVSVFIRVIDAILLIVLGIVTLRMFFRALRENRYSTTRPNSVSRIITGIFCGVVAGAALYALILLIIPS